MTWNDKYQTTEIINLKSVRAIDTSREICYDKVDEEELSSLHKRN
jgi:hypothetical protein